MSNGIRETWVLFLIHPAVWVSFSLRDVIFFFLTFLSMHVRIFTYDLSFNAGTRAWHRIYFTVSSSSRDMKNELCHGTSSTSLNGCVSSMWTHYHLQLFEEPCILVKNSKGYREACFVNITVYWALFRKDVFFSPNDAIGFSACIYVIFKNIRFFGVWAALTFWFFLFLLPPTSEHVCPIVWMNTAYLVILNINFLSLYTVEPKIAVRFFFFLTKLSYEIVRQLFLYFFCICCPFFYCTRSVLCIESAEKILK